MGLLEAVKNFGLWVKDKSPGIMVDAKNNMYENPRAHIPLIGSWNPGSFRRDCAIAFQVRGLARLSARASGLDQDPFLAPVADLIAEEEDPNAARLIAQMKSTLPLLLPFSWVSWIASRDKIRLPSF